MDHVLRWIVHCPCDVSILLELGLHVQYGGEYRSGHHSKYALDLVQHNAVSEAAQDLDHLAWAYCRLDRLGYEP